MKGKFTIEIDGVTYPGYPTMGAMVRFKRETGREVSDMKTTDLSDLCAYIWSCVASACHREGIKFGMDFMTFADAVSPDAVSAWVESTDAPKEDVAEAKKNSR